MDREFHVYVSASSEVDAECEQVGQVLATLARTSRATVRRTPRGSAGANPDLAGLAESDLFIAILATDLSAPMGVEWQAAERAERRCPHDSITHKRAAVFGNELVDVSKRTKRA